MWFVNTKGTDAQKEKYQLADKPLSEDTFDELKVLVKKLSEKSTELDEADLSSSDRDIFSVMRGLNLLKAVTLSPYLSTCQKKAGIEPTYQIRQGSGTTMREPRKYSFGANELPSTLGLTGYFLTRYIQNIKNGNNVLHLTATPFTNKPAEIYSMLSLTNRKMLMDSGFLYMEQFFDVFMDISFELIFGNTGVARKESLLGYRNLPQLRNLIYSMMDYKSGEDANIKRPEKLLFPSYESGRETTLPETPTQDELFKQIKNYQRGRIEYAELCADAVEELDVDELTEDELINYLAEKGTDAQKEKYDLLEKPLNEDDFNALKGIVAKLYEKSDDLNESEISDGSERDAFRVVKGRNDKGEREIRKS